MRQRGSGSIFPRGKTGTLWVKYYKDGKMFRESTHGISERDAERLLRRRMAEIHSGTFAGPKLEKIKISELADDFLRDYRINGRASIDDAEARWKHHLSPFFGDFRAAHISSDHVARYVDQRQQEGAANATINRELAALKRMFHLASKATPPKVHRIPAFPHLQENNVRTGFLDDAQYTALVQAVPELWFRALVECGRTYGWRVSELLTMRVGQVDVTKRSIRLEPGTTKNREGREVSMTPAVFELLRACVDGKQASDHVFTRPNGHAVRVFRRVWTRACCKSGVGWMICGTCTKPVSICTCEKAKKRPKYTGLIFHDLRRTAARGLRRAGVAEGIIMKIGGWRTRSVFERYAIVSQSDINDAMSKLEICRAEDAQRAIQLEDEPGEATQVSGKPQ